jgi:hypothetical protein
VEEFEALRRATDEDIKDGANNRRGVACVDELAAPGGTTVPQMTRVAYYPQCYQSVALLRQQDQQFQQTMAVNTLCRGGWWSGARRAGQRG